MSSLLTSFASPRLPFDAAVLHGLALDYVPAAISEYARRWRDLDDTSTTALSLSHLASQPAFTFEQVWCPFFGELRESIYRHEWDLAELSAAQLLLQAAYYGASPNICIEFRTPRAILFGSTMIPSVRRLSISNDVDLPLGTASANVCTQSSGRPELNITSDLQRILLPTLQLEGTELILSSTALLEERRIGGPMSTAAPVPSRDDKNLLSQGLTLLQENLPNYYAWVVSILRHVITVRSSQDLMLNGHIEGFLGMIYLSDNQNPVHVAEMLVHEAAHQYFFLLSRIEPIDDGSDTLAYYNPIVDGLRSVDRIALAFHAFANVCNLYDDLSDVGLMPSASRAAALSKLRADVRTLAGILANSPALTTIGHLLVDPLLEVQYA